MELILPAVDAPIKPRRARAIYGLAPRARRRRPPPADLKNDDPYARVRGARGAALVVRRGRARVRRRVVYHPPRVEELPTDVELRRTGRRAGDRAHPSRPHRGMVRRLRGVFVEVSTPDDAYTLHPMPRDNRRLEAACTQLARTVGEREIDSFKKEIRRASFRAARAARVSRLFGARPPPPPPDTPAATATAGECCVCMDAPACVAFVPCGHVVACVPCSRRVPKKCMVCACAVTSHLKLFFPGVTQ